MISHAIRQDVKDGGNQLGVSFKNYIVSEQVTSRAPITECVYVHHWTIMDYVTQMASTGVIESTTFAAGGHHWALNLMIKGTTVGSVDNLAYSVPTLECKDNPVRVRTCSFTFHNVGKGAKYNAVSGDICQGVNTHAPWPYVGSGPSLFMLRDRLLDLDNGFVVDGSIVLSVTFQLLPSSTASASSAASTTKPRNPVPVVKFTSIHTVEERPSHTCAVLLGDVPLAHADVKLQIGGETILAHKCVLAAHSPVFARMFQPLLPFAEAKDDKDAHDGRVTVNIEDARPDAVRVMIHFLYTGVYPESTERPLSTKSWEELRECLLLADRYEVAALRALLLPILASKVTISNARAAYDLSRLRPEFALLKHSAARCVVNSVDLGDMATAWLGSAALPTSDTVTAPIQVSATPTPIIATAAAHPRVQSTWSRTLSFLACADKQAAQS